MSDFDPHEFDRNREAALAALMVLEFVAIVAVLGLLTYWHMLPIK